MYENIKRNDNLIRTSSKFVTTFIDGAALEIKGNSDKKYLVKFIDLDTNDLVYESLIGESEWARTSRKWLCNWLIEVYDGDTIVYEHKFNAKDKNILISLESSALGDTIAWIPYAEEFRKKWGCNVYISTFHNNLFESAYTNLKFVSPGMSVPNLYGLFRLGWFYDKNIEMDKHKNSFLSQSLQQTATDILGLDYVEIKPKIKEIPVFTHDRPYICIAIHSTAQTKYWNNPTGWQDLVDFVKSKGYDVLLLSKEGNNYMGNKNPNGVIQIQGKNLEEIASILRGGSAFVGIGSGLTWYSWALNVPTILISGFSKPYQEMKSDIVRIINENVCNGCFARYLFDKGDWNWCPDHKDTERQFECTKSITFDMIKPHIEKLLKL